MGRYVGGDFQYKFAFAEQSSSLGEVLEEITNETKDNYIDRYISTQGSGEIVNLIIENYDEFKLKATEFIENSWGKEMLSDDYDELYEKRKFNSDKTLDNFWDAYMIREFLKEITDDGCYSFDVEY